MSFASSSSTAPAASPSVLISASALGALLAPRSAVVVLDCSFDLTNPAAGLQAHAAGHIPGARYVHLDDDLSGPKNGRNGRHPLPDPQVFAARMAGCGVRTGVPVVAYDNAGGMYAARLWWMLRWIGHAEVSVLDGGTAAWKAAGLPLETGSGATPPAGVPATAGSTPPANPLHVRPSLVAAVDRNALLADLASPGETTTRLVVDARSPDRFRGENETLDPVGGRIPGAINRFFKDNLGPEGRFKPAAQLRQEWRAHIGERSPSSLVMQCGSGVTACHNLLALEAAGLAGAALYPGSWSEWCAWPDAPRATGPA